MPRGPPIFSNQEGNTRGGNVNTQWRPQGTPQRKNSEPPKPTTKELLAKWMAYNDARMKNLEVQSAQMQKALSKRTTGTLPSTTEKNPRGRVQAITLRSGRQLEEVKELEEDEAKAQPTSGEVPKLQVEEVVEKEEESL